MILSTHVTLFAVIAIASSLDAQGLLAPAGVPHDSAPPTQVAPAPSAPAASRDRGPAALPHGAKRSSGVLQTARGRIAEAVGVCRCELGLVGIGPDYQVSFRDQEVEFVPVLGATAPGDLPLRYRLLSVGRGQSHVPAEMPIVRHVGRTVTYARGPLTENYEVRVAGLEQWFQLDSLPRGSGDLVVRARVASPGVAELVDLGAGGVRFRMPGVGGVDIGAVLAEDAAGTKSPCRIRVIGDIVEYVVAEQFVDTAVLPLTIDPLIGTASQVQTSLYGAFDIAVANSTLDPLLVYERYTSAVNVDIMGVLFGSLAIPVVIDAGASSDRQPAVTWCSTANHFVVAYTRGSNGGGLLGRAVHAASVTVGAAVPIDSTFDVKQTPAIASTGDAVLCAWHNATVNRIQVCKINIAPSGVITPLAASNLGTATAAGQRQPRISKGDLSSVERYLVAWHVEYPGPEADVHYQVISRNAVPATHHVISNSTAFDDAQVDVDGNGSRWLIVFQRRAVAGSDTDVFGWPVFFDTARNQLVPELAGPVPVENTTQRQIRPRVRDFGGSFLVAYSEQYGSSVTDYDIYVEDMDPYRCSVCGPRQALTTAASYDVSVAIATTRNGFNLAANDAFIAWDEGGAGLFKQEWRAHPAGLTFEGNGCGGGGISAAPCAFVGNVDFRVFLRGASASTAAVLLMSPDTLRIGCGACVMVPDPYTGFAFFTTTDTHGNAIQQLPIPANSGVLGVSLSAQWLTARASGAACQALQVDFSTANRFHVLR